MLRIIDINGKHRTVKDNLRVITHNRKNDTVAYKLENIDGELVQTPEILEIESDEKFIEVVVVGKNREWVEWYPLEIFEKMNPEIKVVS